LSLLRLPSTPKLASIAASAGAQSGCSFVAEIIGGVQSTAPKTSKILPNYSKKLPNIALYFNFRQPLSYEEAKAFCPGAERIDSLSVMTTGEH